MTFDSRWKNPQGADPKTLYLWAQVPSLNVQSYTLTLLRTPLQIKNS